MTFIVAIDGLAGSGKGTIARELAKQYNLAYLDTGSIYRGLALLLVQNKVDFEQEAPIKQFLEAHFQEQDLFLAMGNPKIRTDEIAAVASKISGIPMVRARLLAIQQNFGKNPLHGQSGTVLDGRDIGTVVCPEAQVKFYFVASLEERAKRRFRDLSFDDISITYEDVLEDMRKRDERDSQRTIAPLIQAKDAILIDTTKMNINDVFRLCCEIIDQKTA